MTGIKIVLLPCLKIGAKHVRAKGNINLGLACPRGAGVALHLP